METLRIRRQVLEQIERHARDSLPAECCGILLASFSAPETINGVLRGKNIESDEPAQRYALGHRAHIKAIEMELAGAFRVAGYYHSHPRGAAMPSAHDRSLAAPNVVYLIVAVGEEPARHAAWRLADGALAQLSLEVRE